MKNKKYRDTMIALAIGYAGAFLTLLITIIYNYVTKT